MPRGPAEARRVAPAIAFVVAAVVCGGYIFMAANAGRRSADVVVDQRTPAATSAPAPATTAAEGSSTTTGVPLAPPPPLAPVVPRCVLGCAGHGRCVFTNISAPEQQACDCGEGWLGDDCATAWCTAAGCHGHGACSSAGASAPVCACEDGWGVPLEARDRYETCRMPACAYSPCGEHASCDLARGCVCTEGWIMDGSGTCVRDCMTKGCGVHAACDAREGCLCTSGWNRSAAGECDVPFCADTLNGTSVCATREFCDASLDPPRCVCRPGWNITTVGNCSVAWCNGLCGPHSTCVSRHGTAGCVCASGWNTTDGLGDNMAPIGVLPNCSVAWCDAPGSCGPNAHCSHGANPQCACATRWQRASTVSTTSVESSKTDTLRNVSIATHTWITTTTTVRDQLACVVPWCNGTAACGKHANCEFHPEFNLTVAECVCAPGYNRTNRTECGTPWCQDGCGPSAFCNTTDPYPTCSCRNGFTRLPGVSPNYPPDKAWGLACQVYNCSIGDCGHGFCVNATLNTTAHPVDWSIAVVDQCVCDPGWNGTADCRTPWCYDEGPAECPERQTCNTDLFDPPQCACSIAWNVSAACDVAWCSTGVCGERACTDNSTVWPNLPNCTCSFDYNASKAYSFDEWMDMFMCDVSNYVVGASIGVVFPDGSTRIFHSGSRYPQYSQTVAPPDDDTVFALGSVSKTLVGLMLSVSILKGEVYLDQPISELLPSSVNIPTYPCAPGVITLRHLTTHTSGLPRVPSNLDEESQYPIGYPGVPFTMDPFTYMWLNQCSIEHCLWDPPGAAYNYSNIGAGILAHGLERRIGIPYEQAVYERILWPLGMNDTHLAEFPDGFMDRKAQGHHWNAMPAEDWTYCPALGPAGRWWSTMPDMLKYIKAAMNLSDVAFNDYPAADRSPAAAPRPVSELLQRAFVQQQSVLITRNESNFSQLAMNIEIDKVRPSNATGHNGATPTFTAQLMFRRDWGVGVMVLNNEQGPGRPYAIRAVADAVLRRAHGDMTVVPRIKVNATATTDDDGGGA